MEVAAFDNLLCEIVPSYDAAERERRRRPERLRAIGGGDHSDLEVRDQLLLTLIWLRLYPRQDILGQFFGISQPTVWRYIQRMVPLLEQTTIHDEVRQSNPSRRGRRDLRTLLIDVPELLGVIGSWGKTYKASRD